MRLTFTLIGVNVAVFVLQLAGLVGESFALTPSMAFDGAWWQFITYMFLHGGTLHIFLNMFVLGIFGPPVEHALGGRNFLVLYLLAGLGSAGLHIILTGIVAGPLVISQTLLGASGAVFGVLTAYAFLFPKNIILVFFIPMPALIAVAVITLFEFVAGLLNILPGIANFGHLGGIATGAALMLVWRATMRKIPVEERDFRNYEFFWE